MSHRRILLNTLSFIPDRESPVGSSACSSPPPHIPHHTGKPKWPSYSPTLSSLPLPPPRLQSPHQVIHYRNCLACPFSAENECKIYEYFSHVYAAVPSPFFVKSFLLLTNLPTGKTRLDPHQPRPANWPLSSLWLLIKLSVYFNQLVPFFIDTKWNGNVTRILKQSKNSPCMAMPS